MAKISLKCEQCGGNIILDDSHEVGICEHCFSQFLIKQEQIVQNITQNVTQNITKQVYGNEGKDVEELLSDAYKLMKLEDRERANSKFKQAINIEPDCWGAWFGYASTGGDRNKYLSFISAYRRAYVLASTEKQKTDTFVDMTYYLSDYQLRGIFIRAFNMAVGMERNRIFELVSGVIGCDESEMIALAIDLCPNDWRTHFLMAKYKQIRVRWCKLEGGFLEKKRLPKHAVEVLNIFMHTYQLAKNEGKEAKETVLSHINEMSKEESYRIFANELKKKIECEK